MVPMRSVLIVGGGTAGWLAACYLQRTLAANPQLGVRITLVESPEIGAIGVGEATVPTLRNTMAAIGLPENALFTAADASLKNGIRFVGWQRGGDPALDRYDHPFDAPPPFEGYTTALHWLNLKQRGADLPPLADAASVQTALFDGGLSPKLMQSPDYQAPVSYAYHLDAVRLAALLRQTAVDRGVVHLQGEVVGVDAGPDGLRAVALADGRRLEADFFVDCSGFRSLLLGGALGVPWISYADQLPCDRAVACPVDAGTDTPLRTYTQATAQGAGWTWEIDLPTRRGTGHVYASAHCSDDEAVATLRRLHGGAVPLAEPRLLAMKVGHYARAWDRNCLALGLAGGFIEPLESTAIYLIEHALQAFVDHLPAHAGDRACRDRFNALMGDLYDELRDFVLLHYAISMRRDTAFWRQVTDPARLPASLAEALALWDAKMPSPSDMQRRIGMFGAHNWFYILAGLKRLPSHGTGQGHFIAPESSQRALRQAQLIRTAARQQSPTMRDYLRKQRAAFGNRPAPVAAAA